MSSLSSHHFADFFRETHSVDPFPWQMRLAERVLEEGRWPEVLDLPTSSGKTAAIDIAVFHLAAEAERGPNRRAPVRIAFVVDRRLVVDDAFTRAQKIAKSLLYPPPGSIREVVAQRLTSLTEDGPPLIPRRLRGGVPREEDWARTPSQPTILCSTVDQVGSRLLFRGYGVSDRMKPVHAGLIGADCLILLDESHLAEPFLETLERVGIYRGEKWRKAKHPSPWGFTQLSATSREMKSSVFRLEQADHEHPVLSLRLNASKIARLIGPDKVKSNSSASEEVDTDEEDVEEKEQTHRTRTIVDEARNALRQLKESGTKCPVVGIVVNRVARARAVFEALKDFRDSATLILLLGPSREIDRSEIVKQLASIRTGESRPQDKPFLLVSTQCIEVGVDIDLDALITEAAPIDSLCQRFGRLNRSGRSIRPYASIIAVKSDLNPRNEDPIYGASIKATWDYLTSIAMKKDGLTQVDFGVNPLSRILDQNPVTKDARTSEKCAPILLPAHLDLISQTSPIPTADPETALYLHGPRRLDSVVLVWRRDIISPSHSERDQNPETARILSLMSPKSAEAIELPIWAVRAWLEKRSRRILNRLGDTAASDPEEETTFHSASPRMAFRWKGSEEDSGWINPGEIRFGDTLIVPASYGGVDEFGWNPSLPGPLENEDAIPVKDVAENAAAKLASRRFVVRVAPGLIGKNVTAATLANTLGTSSLSDWEDVQQALLDLDLPEELKTNLKALDRAKKRRHVQVYSDLYGKDDRGNPRGVIFLAPFGIRMAAAENGGNETGSDRLKEEDRHGLPNSTEDDSFGSTPGFAQSLEEHSSQVESKARVFAAKAGLPASIVEDIALTGYLHDAGKADRRFQAWLAYGDPLGGDLEDGANILAKSDRWLPAKARAQSGLPDRWRHEAYSVRLASVHSRLSKANDPDLVLWLIGTHHGYGRPFFPHHDTEDGKEKAVPGVLGMAGTLLPSAGPQSLAFNWKGRDWAGLFKDLTGRYGPWELARMEAILRLADHRASEETANKEVSKGESR